MNKQDCWAAETPDGPIIVFVTRGAVSVTDRAGNTYRKLTSVNRWRRFYRKRHTRMAGK